MSDLISRQMAIDEWKNDFKGYINALNMPKDDYDGIMEYIDELPSAQPERKTKFVKLTVRNSNGRPYYSIIYLEDGNEFEGYSSYSLDVISDYLKRYFEFAQPERKTGHWIPVDSYTAFGGDEMAWLAHGNPIAYHYCSECKNHAYALEDGEDLLSDFCPNCGSPMLKEGEE